MVSLRSSIRKWLERVWGKTHDETLARTNGNTRDGLMEHTVKFVPPGGYRACSNCAAAKAKCIRPDEAPHGKCER